VGGVLVVGGAVANVAMNNAVDDRAEDIQRALRNDLVAVSDETLADYPESRKSIEARAVESLRDLPGGVVGSAHRDEDDPVIVAVETRWGIQARCVTAELRGDGVVLTEIHGGGC
jgi:hypothetical protein